MDDNYKGTGHSPFTYFLLKELEYNENSFLEATDLSQAVARNVAINVQQTPVRGVLQGAGHEGGEFFFLKRGLGKPFAAADPAPPEFPAAQGAARETPARPQAASPFAASAMPMMGLAQGAAGGGMVMSAGGGMLGLIALFEYLKMVEFHNLAVETANSDPDASRQFEESRNAAATTVLGSALLGAGLLAWAIWGAENGNVAAVEAGHLTPQFGLAPANLGPGFAVRLHW